MARRTGLRQFLTNLDQPMPLPEKVRKLTGNLWRRAVLRQTRLVDIRGNRDAE